jgi:CHAD domain-containing protein
MSFKRYQYALPRRSNSHELADLLHREGLTVSVLPAMDIERSFHDSFDWRLYAADLLLFIDHAGSRRRLILRSLANGLDIVSVDVDEDPRFAAELPDGVLRQRVAPLLAPRRLLEQARLRTRSRFLHVLDDDDKTVARLCIERNSVYRDEGRPRRLRDRVAVIPVQGFDDWLERLRGVFEQTLAWERIQAPVLGEALTALGRRPLDYSAKPSRQFDPRLPAGLAARALLSDLFGVIEANEEGVRHDLDVEFLHDLRVATRRTRTLLGQMKKLLSSPRFIHFRNEFAWFGRMTGPVRDLDVHLIEFPRYAAWAGAERAGDLAPLLALLRRRRSDERRRLLEVLASPRYRNLKSSWRRLLDNDTGAEWTAGEAGLPVSVTVADIIRKRHDKVLKRGRRLDTSSPDGEFHELRKECKKLRYVMELFSGQFPRSGIRQLIKALKGLQDNLGEFQDLCVHRESLLHYSEALQTDEAAGERCVEAIAAVIDGIEARKRAVHGDFAGAFRRFADASERKRTRLMYEESGMAATA